MQPRRLLLVRHAQAAAGPVDAERPLTKRGALHAAAIGSWLAQAGLVPDRVLVSPARRALQTWERANTSLVPGRPGKRPGPASGRPVSRRSFSRSRSPPSRRVRQL